MIEAARRMDVARVDPQDADTILTSVRLNWRIWTIIQAALVDPECPLPKQIRENLINLSNFIDKRSAHMIANPNAVEKMDVLININRQVGAGLLGNSGEDAGPEKPAESQPSEAAEQPAAANPNASAYSNSNQDTQRSTAGTPLGRSTSTEA